MVDVFHGLAVSVSSTSPVSNTVCGVSSLARSRLDVDVLVLLE